MAMGMPVDFKMVFDEKMNIALVHPKDLTLVLILTLTLTLRLTRNSQIDRKIGSKPSIKSIV